MKYCSSRTNGVGEVIVIQLSKGQELVLKPEEAEELSNELRELST